MIPANQPYEARYKHDNDGRVHYTTKRVIAWDEDGHPLVIGRDNCPLDRASNWSNFHDVVAVDSPVISALPGAGWRAEFRDDDGSLDSTPLSAWLVNADGNIKPCDVHPTGYADDPTTVSNFVRLYHPSAEDWKPKAPTPPPAPPRSTRCWWRAPCGGVTVVSPRTSPIRRRSATAHWR